MRVVEDDVLHATFTQVSLLHKFYITVGNLLEKNIKQMLSPGSKRKNSDINSWFHASIVELQ